jgi:hypothetical protein
MRKVLLVGFVLVASFGLGGCGSKAENAFKESIAAVNEMAQAFESVKDDASADAAIPRLQKAAQRFQDIAKQRAALKLDPSEEKRLQEQYMPEMSKAMQKLIVAATSAAFKAPKKARDMTAALAKVKL